MSGADDTRRALQAARERIVQVLSNLLSWECKQFGASPPVALLELMARSRHEVMAACGLSPALFDHSDTTREG